MLTYIKIYFFYLDKCVLYSMLIISQIFIASLNLYLMWYLIRPFKSNILSIFRILYILLHIYFMNILICYVQIICNIYPSTFLQLYTCIASLRKQRNKHIVKNKVVSRVMPC